MRGHTEGVRCFHLVSEDKGLVVIWHRLRRGLASVQHPVECQHFLEHRALQYALTIVTETGSSRVLSPVNLVSVRTPPQSSLLPPEAVDPILPPKGFGAGTFPELD